MRAITHPAAAFGALGGQPGTTELGAGVLRGGEGVEELAGAVSVSAAQITMMNPSTARERPR